MRFIIKMTKSMPLILTLSLFPLLSIVSCGKSKVENKKATAEEKISFCTKEGNGKIFQIHCTKEIRSFSLGPFNASGAIKLNDTVIKRSNQYILDCDLGSLNERAELTIYHDDSFKSVVLLRN